MMSLSDLALSFWGYALEMTAFTLNRAPSKSIEMTPYELWFGKKPKLLFLKVWGCDAYVKELQPDKLKPKLEKCVGERSIQKICLRSRKIYLGEAYQRAGRVCPRTLVDRKRKSLSTRLM